MSISELMPVREYVVELSKLLLQRELRIATVESCTGGGIAALLTDLPGSSQWFERGFVTYSNQAKMEMVGVDATTLEMHGAVSEAVALEMAAGGVAHSRAECALAVTGIAGPDGGSPDKPVGMVCFAWAGFGRSDRAETRYFTGGRDSVRQQSALHAIRVAVTLIE